MRAGMGLLSLLIVACIIFYVSYGGKQGGLVGVEMKAGKDAREQASQMSGRTDDGVPIKDTIVLDEVDAGGEFRRLKVVSIIPQTPMDAAYKLMPGDEITQVGPLGVRDNNNPELAKDLVYGAYGQNQPLTILRNGQEMTLTPDSALTKFHPNYFGKPGTVVSPNSVPVVSPDAATTPAVVPVVPQVPAVPSN